jgi:hypothetical protein
MLNTLGKYREEEFTNQVLELALHCGWFRAHFRAAETKNGWRTAVSGDGKGFPDLFMVRGSRALAAELKMPGNKPSIEQEAWLAALSLTPIETYLWYPKDWDEIVKVFAR